MVERKLVLRDRALRRKLAARVTPGLPVDADAIELRRPIPLLGSTMPALIDELLVEKSPFFDAVCSRWSELFPELAARPGRFEDGRLFLYVRSSGQVFGLRSKLARIKKTLAGLSEAPPRFTIHLEIHAEPQKA
ncbi:MAG: hypothetical protein ACI4Q3_05870 [Kiritimatiellia bacterium]